MTSQTPKFAAAFTFALIVLIVGYFSGSSPAETSTTYVFPDAPAEQRASVSQDPPSNLLQDLNTAFTQLAENASPAVVTISTERTIRRQQVSPFDMFDEFFGRRGQSQPREREFQQRGQGSGVIVESDGFIMTNHHVIANADTIIVRLQNDVNLGAEVIGSDPSTDIAILRVDAENLPFLEFGDSDALRVGEWVMAIGSPLSQSLNQTVTQGIVSAKGRSNINLVDYEDFIQTDAAINPGNSGGPLINMNGELVGINTAIASRSGGFQGIGFAVPINMARSVMESLIETGRVVRAFLGIYAENVDDSMARALEMDRARGIYVMSVTEESPAAQAGIRELDVILEIDGRTVTDFRQFRTFVASRTPGTTVRLRILRDGEEITKNVTLAELDQDEAPEVQTESFFEQFGFSVDSFSEEFAERYRLRSNLEGVVVTQVDQSSNAFRQGLREGDLITGVQRQRVRNMQEFSQRMEGVQPGQTILLQLVRQNRQFFIAVDL